VKKKTYALQVVAGTQLVADVDAVLLRHSVALGVLECAAEVLVGQDAVAVADVAYMLPSS
jgi:hypothetical protein